MASESTPDSSPETDSPTGSPAEGMAPETEVFESDPNADSAEGLEGGMGVSSERTGSVRGDAPGTYGANETHPDVDTETGLPEQRPGGPDVQPDQPPLKKHHDRLD